jgi:hypothetical protein
MAFFSRGSGRVLSLGLSVAAIVLSSFCPAFSSELKRVFVNKDYETFS